MSGVRQVEVGRDEADLRLDRWFKRHFPNLSHIRLEKLLRTGQVRVDGGRVKAAHRLAAGMIVRVPPFDEASVTAQPRVYQPKPPTPAEIEALQSLVLYRDRDVLAINKPAGVGGFG